MTVGERMETLEAPGNGRVIAAVIIMAIIGVIMLFVIRPLSNDATERQAYQYQIAQAQASAQQTAEQERTERERLNVETERQAAVLRAEQDARTTNHLAVIGTIAAVVLGGLLIIGFMMFMVSWTEGKQLQRTILLIEAQRQAALDRADSDVLLITSRGSRVIAEHGSAE